MRILQVDARHECLTPSKARLLLNSLLSVGDIGESSHFESSAKMAAAWESCGVSVQARDALEYPQLRTVAGLPLSIRYDVPPNVFALVSPNTLVSLVNLPEPKGY